MSEADRVGRGIAVKPGPVPPKSPRDRGIFWINSEDGNLPYYTDPDGNSAPVGANAGLSPQSVVGSAAIDQFAVIKVSGPGPTYAMLDVNGGDLKSQMAGVAATACIGSGQSFTAWLISGTQTTMLSDGTGTISAGSPVSPSDTVPGRIMAGATDICGISLEDVAATLDAQLEVL